MIDHPNHIHIAQFALPALKFCITMTMQSQSQSLPLLPATYHTTNQTRNGISLAYSNFHNPPGLEKMWNAPWLGTLNSLVERYDGLFTVHSEYPMFIPSLIIKDLNLRRRFEENGMDYHDIDDGCSSDDSEGDQEDSLMLSETRQSAKLLVFHNTEKVI
jgi:hypothetical protein